RRHWLTAIRAIAAAGRSRIGADESRDGQNNGAEEGRVIFAWGGTTMTFTLRIEGSGRTHRLSRWANRVAFLPVVAAIVAGAGAAGASFAADESSQPTLME